jgi:hypothetical protein
LARLKSAASGPSEGERMILFTLLEAYRSTRKSDCDERAFMLTAVGIPSRLDFDGQQYVLKVD